MHKKRKITIINRSVPSPCCHRLHTAANVDGFLRATKKMNDGDVESRFAVVCAMRMLGLLLLSADPNTIGVPCAIDSQAALTFYKIWRFRSHHMLPRRVVLLIVHYVMK